MLDGYEAHLGEQLEVGGRRSTTPTCRTIWPTVIGSWLAASRCRIWSGGRVVGWTALDPVSDRCAYAGVAEDSIYGIFPENQASVRLHEACEFRVVGVRECLGRLHGRWRDVLLLERRSPTIG